MAEPEAIDLGWGERVLRGGLDPEKDRLLTGDVIKLLNNKTGKYVAISLVSLVDREAGIIQVEGVRHLFNLEGTGLPTMKRKSTTLGEVVNLDGKILVPARTDETDILTLPVYNITTCDVTDLSRP